MEKCKAYAIRLFAVLGLLGYLSLTAAAAAPHYTMQLHNGFVAVWDHRDQSWLLHTDVPETMLQSSDRALLQQGLELADSAALTQALEDFCS